MTAITNAFHRTPEYMLDIMPPHMRKTYRRALSGKSRQAAINAQCYECLGWEREAVKKCTVDACSLWKYRPQGRPTKKGVDTE